MHFPLLCALVTPLVRAVNCGEVGAAGVAFDHLLEALLVAAAGGVVEGAMFNCTTVSEASYTIVTALSSTLVVSTAVVTLFPTVVAPIAAVLLSVFFPPVVPALVLDLVLPAFEALHHAGVTLRMHVNPVTLN